MASERLFVIGVGGTGMRCVEAFIHLCAIGMFDDREINILLIDTDTNNGNKSRTEQLSDAYLRIKGTDGEATAQTFFSAKLNLFRYAPRYAGDTLTYSRLSGLSTGGEETRRRNRELSALLFEADVQEFQLDHGYRAQTHLGSHLMYHAFIEAARNVRLGAARREDEALMKFIERVHDAKDDARVFILGSIFGGTGASAIPIFPKAIGDALKVWNPAQQISEGARFGCCLLTDYFAFNVPDAVQRREQRIIADSTNFARNSQAAMMFYEDDATVKRRYQRMYHIGWPTRVDWSTDAGGGQTVTGGAEQRNPAHVAELLCAAAAHDFLHDPNVRSETEIVYRSAQRDGVFQLEPRDLFASPAAEGFRARLGALYALAHVVAVVDQGARHTIAGFARNNVPDYGAITDAEAQNLDDYLRAFAFGLERERVIPGWVWQLRNSVGGPFLLEPDAFQEGLVALRGFNYGRLYPDPAHQFAARGGLFGLGGGKPYEELTNALYNDKDTRPRASQRVRRPMEQFLAHVHNAFVKLYKFS
jgi:hypothetical protein